MTVHFDCEKLVFLERQRGKKGKNENGYAFSVDEEPCLLFVCLAVWLIGWLANLVLEAGKTQGNTIFKNKKKQQQEILRTEKTKEGWRTGSLPEYSFHCPGHGSKLFP